MTDSALRTRIRTIVANQNAALQSEGALDDLATRLSEKLQPDPKRPGKFFDPATGLKDKTIVRETLAQAPHLLVGGDTDGFNMDAVISGNFKGANNPLSKAYRGSEAQRQKRIEQILKRGGTSMLRSLAKSAGTNIAGKPLQKTVNNF